MPDGSEPRAHRTVARRVGHHALPLVSAALAVLVAAAAVTVLTALSGRAVTDGMRRQLAGDRRLSVSVQTELGAAGAQAAADRSVRAAFHRVLADVPYRVETAARSAAPLTAARPAGQPALPAESVLLPVGLAEPGRHAQLTAGSWPVGGAGAEVAAAVPDEWAQRTGVRPGDVLVLTSPANRTVALRVTGRYRAAPLSGAFWQGLAEPDREVERAAALVSPAAFRAEAALADGGLAEWVALPEVSRLPVSELAGLRARSAAFGTGDPVRSVYREAPPPVGGTAIRTALPELLAGTALPMLAARSSLYVPATLLTVLATLTLALTARQLAESSAAETVLRLARGAGGGRLLLAAAGEWAAFSLPAALAGMLVVAPLAMAGAGASTGSVVAVAAMLLVHGGAVVLPVARLALSGARDAAVRGRSARRTAVQQAGADLALLLAAVLGWLQLRHYGGPVADPARVGFDTWADPVLVLAPAAVLTAGALVLLRLLPPLMRLAERAAALSTGLVLPLSSWRISRRPGGPAASVLLSVLALSVCAFSATALASLGPNYRDRAAAAVGADLGLSGGGLASDRRAAALAALPGVRAVSPVVEARTDLGNLPVQAVAVNSRTAQQTLSSAGAALPALRADLADRPLDALLPLLRRGTPAYGLPVPEGTTALELSVGLAADAPLPAGAVRLVLLVEDADGLSRTLAATVPTDGVRRPLRFDLSAPVTAARPARVARVAVQPAADLPGRRSLTLDLERITAVGPSARHDLAPPAGLGWTATAPGAGRPEDIGCPGHPAAGSAGRIPETSDDLAGPCTLTEPAGGLLLAVLRTQQPNGMSDGRTPEVAYTVAAEPDAPPLPVLADDALLAAGVRVGSRLLLVPGGDPVVRAVVVGRIAVVPGLPRDRPAVLADSRAFAAQRILGGSPPVPEARWWLAAGPDGGRAAQTALRGHPELGTVRSLRDEAATLAADPYQAGLRRTLWLCLLLAPLFALAGTTVQAAADARSRSREFAVLRAIGVAPGRLAAVLRTEMLTLTGAAVLLGAVLGLLSAALLLPLVVVDGSASAVFPALRIGPGWTATAAAALATGALVGAGSSVLARRFARVDLARTLRAGEDG
ncbi:FtsX-like permease family protein [Streptomyces sp. NRRL B-24484]|uniref:FtsX-like permease family protein n=1 Tax=Streptomyces sp. NRRL B-24484 TaxID=1463833 RepID=UPI0004C00509|nr:FtsX-like permease family protein [Streptomyces sp. NRRL B-24484]